VIVCNPREDRVVLYYGTDILEGFTVSQWRQFVSGTLGSRD
jgi:hypothetical protein